MSRLENKVCVVTGATKGIGRATACLFSREGANVVGVGRDSDAGQTLQSEIGHSRFELVTLDLTDRESPDRVADAALARFGRVDVLVNCAARDHAEPLLDASSAEIDDVMATNVVAPLRLLQSVAREMQPGSSIVNLTSRLATVGVPSMSVYGASKGAVLALTRGAAVELAPRGIRVNAVAPGLTETPLTEAWLAEADDPHGRRADAESAIPQQRFGTAGEVANAVLFLASDESSHVTGVSLPVDGGYTAA